MSVNIQVLTVFGAAVIVAVPLAWIAMEQRRRRLRERTRDAEHQALVESLSDMQEGVLIVEAGRLVSANGVVQELLGWSEAEMLAWDDYLQIFHPDERPRIERNHQRRMAGERFQTRYESALLRRDGGRLEVDLAAARLRLGESSRVVVIFRDITAQKHAREQLAAEVRQRREAEVLLKESEHQLRTIADNLPVLIGYVDQDLRYRFNNRTYGDWFGVDPDTLTGKSIVELLGDEGFQALEPRYRRVLAGERMSFEARELIRGMPRDTQITYIPDAGEDGMAQGFFVMVQDITERKRHEEELRYQALHDGLTGLLNRPGLMARLERSLARARRHDKAMAVLFLDLDAFKRINDTLGHKAGDQLLQGVAQRLTTLVRETDTVARLGGDEFVVLLEGLRNGAEDVVAVAGKVVESMAEPFLLGGQAVTVTVSVGATIYRGGEVRPDQVLNRADQAMYQVKHSGKNAFHVGIEPARSA